MKRSPDSALALVLLGLFIVPGCATTSEDLETLATQAALLSMFGQLDESERLANEYIWKSNASKTGPLPRVALAYQTLGEIKYKRGLLALSHDYFRKACELFAKLDNQKGSRTLARLGYASVLMEMHEFDRAEAELTSELLRLKGMTRADPQDTVRTMAQLGSVKLHLQKTDEAAALFDEATRLLETLCSGHAELASALRFNRAAVLVERGRYEEAIKIFKADLEDATWRGKEATYAAVIIRKNLAEVLGRVGRHAEAFDLDLRNLAIVTEKYGPSQPIALRIKVTLVDRFLVAGRLEEAIDYLKQAEADLKALESEGSPLPSEAERIRELKESMANEFSGKRF